MDLCTHGTILPSVTGNLIELEIGTQNLPIIYSSASQLYFLSLTCLTAIIHYLDQLTYAENNKHMANQPDSNTKAHADEIVAG